MDKLLQRLNLLLKQEYFFGGIDKSEEISKIIESLIEHLLTLSYTESREFRKQLSGLFNESYITSIKYLLYLFVTNVPKLDEFNNDASEIIDRDYDFDSIKTIFTEELLKLHDGKELRLSDFNLSRNYNREIKIDLFNFLGCLQTIENGQFTDHESFEDNLVFHLKIYCIMHATAKDLGVPYLEQFYYGIKSVFQHLNLFNYTQKGRDLGEEVLRTSIIDNVPHYGWYVMFCLYTSQFNIIDSLLYGCTCLFSLIKMKTISKRMLMYLMLEVLVFFRNFQIANYAEKIYKKYRVLFNQDNYLCQRFDCSYFYLMVMRKDPDFYRTVLDYLDRNIENLKQYREHSSKPWLALLYGALQIIKCDDSMQMRINEYISIFESFLDPKLLDILKAKILAGYKESKSEFKMAFRKLNETRNVEDYASETSLLLPTSNRLLSSSTRTSDIEGFILASTLNNDCSVNFDEKIIDGEVMPLSFSQTSYLNSDFIDNCVEFVRNKVKLLNGQLALWLTISDGILCYLAYDGNGFSRIFQSIGWAEVSARNWIKMHANEMVFDENMSYDSETLKKFYETLNFSFLELPINNGIIVFPDLELSAFPHNLISIGSAIIADKYPICNAISPLLYSEISSKLASQQMKMDISAWIPSSGDFAIHYIYDKTRGILEKYNAKIITEELPSSEMDSLINIFVGHGGIGIDGFKTLYTSSGNAIASIKRIVGRGAIAILFVCHGGAMPKRLFRNEVKSLVNSMLEQGYSTVIGPAWSLNIKIPALWLEHFLRLFSEGHTVMESVFLANIRVKETYALPHAWAAMHVYGYPNLKI